MFALLSPLTGLTHSNSRARFGRHHRRLVAVIIVGNRWTLRTSSSLRSTQPICSLARCAAPPPRLWPLSPSPSLPLCLTLSPPLLQLLRRPALPPRPLHPAAYPPAPPPHRSHHLMRPLLWHLVFLRSRSTQQHAGPPGGGGGGERQPTTMTDAPRLAARGQDSDAPTTVLR